jgi:hypothetical protein
LRAFSRAAAAAASLSFLDVLPFFSAPLIMSLDGRASPGPLGALAGSPPGEIVVCPGVPGLGTGVLVSGGGAEFDEAAGGTEAGAGLVGGALCFKTANIINGTASKTSNPDRASR